MIVSKVRAAVSKDRIRFNDKKHDLDLTYITNNIIGTPPHNQNLLSPYGSLTRVLTLFSCSAMGVPASGIEATYRNNIEDVSNMLKTYHGTDFMIWNLRFFITSLSILTNCSTHQEP